MMFNGDYFEEKQTNFEDNNMSWVKVINTKIVMSIDAIPNIINTE